MKDMNPKIADHYKGYPMSIKPLVKYDDIDDIPVEPSIWKVIPNELNFRSEAKIADNIIRVLQKDEKVIVYAIAGNDSEWVAVITMTDNLDGYVHGDYIRYYSDIPTIPDDNLEQRVTELEDEVEELEHTVSGLNNSIIDLEARVKALEDDTGTTNTVFSEGAQATNSRVLLEEGSDYYVEEIFTTYNGSWIPEQYDEIWAISQEEVNRWNRDWNDPTSCRNCGAEQHILTVVLDKNDNILNKEIVFWSNDSLEPDSEAAYRIQEDERIFNINIPIYNNLLDGQTSPWKIKISGQSCDIANCGGLPNNRHVSHYVVFRQK